MGFEDGICTQHQEFESDKRCKSLQIDNNEVCIVYKGRRDKYWFQRFGREQIHRQQTGEQKSPERDATSLPVNPEMVSGDSIQLPMSMLNQAFTDDSTGATIS